MSLGELLVIFVVGIIALGPKQLPMLSQHLSFMVKAFVRMRSDCQAKMEKILLQAQLEENNQRAEKADQSYDKM